MEGIGLKYKRESIIPNLDNPFVQNAQLYSELPTLFVTVELITGNTSSDICHITPFSARTSSKCFVSQCLWDEAIVFPIKYRDLPLDAKVVFAVWDVLAPSRATPVAVAALNLFGKSQRLKRGRKKIRLTETYGGGSGSGSGGAGEDSWCYGHPLYSEAELEDTFKVRRLEKMTKRLTDQHWLNPFTTAKVMQMKSASECLGDNSMYLFVELPSFAAPVRFFETPHVVPNAFGVLPNQIMTSSMASYFQSQSLSLSQSQSQSLSTPSSPPLRPVPTIAAAAVPATTATTASSSFSSSSSVRLGDPSAKVGSSPLAAHVSSLTYTSPLTSSATSQLPKKSPLPSSPFPPSTSVGLQPTVSVAQQQQQQQQMGADALPASSPLGSAAPRSSSPASVSSLPGGAGAGAGGPGGGFGSIGAGQSMPFIPSTNMPQIVGGDAFANKTKSYATYSAAKGSERKGSRGKGGNAGASSGSGNGGPFLLFNDPGLGYENPAEEMYTKLIKSSHQKKDLRVTEALKLSIDKVKQIDDILKYPPLRALDHKDMELLWNYAPCLVKMPKALAPFLRSVQWDNPDDIKYALAMLRSWEPPAPEDVLILLSKLYPCEQVRKYAVDRLREAADDEFLATYLLQLVQALRHEAGDEVHYLSDFLNERASANPTLASSYYWYLKVASESKKDQDKYYSSVLATFMLMKPRPKQGGDAEVEVPGKIIKWQTELINNLQQAQVRLKESGKPRPVQIKMLQEMVSPGNEFERLYDFVPTRLIVDPQYTITGIIPESLYIFKSNLMPLKIGFRTREPVENPAGGLCGNDKMRYNVIFKSGDDMRQDQLMVQMIAFMNNLLKKENLDLKVLSYRVLATAEREGMMECVGNSESIDHIITSRKSLQAYLTEYNPDPDGPYGIKEEVLDTYVRSCAGSSVITYLLGVGDRHLDNLMLTQDGHFFHIDFSYILGNDIKPRPSPMKLCKEMIAAMGGTQSQYYTLFQQYCCEAYNILRMSATHIINLFQLMIDGGLNDLTQDSLKKLEDKFHLEMSDLEATKFMLNAIDVSANASIPAMVDQIHRIAQYLKS